MPGSGPAQPTGNVALDVLALGYESNLQSLTELVNRGYFDTCSPEVFRVLEDTARALMTAITTHRTFVASQPEEIVPLPAPPHPSF